MLKTSSSAKVRMGPASKKGWSLRAQEELLHLLTEAEQQKEGTYCVYVLLCEFTFAFQEI